MHELHARQVVSLIRQQITACWKRPTDQLNESTTFLLVLTSASCYGSVVHVSTDIHHSHFSVSQYGSNDSTHRLRTYRPSIMLISLLIRPTTILPTLVVCMKFASLLKLLSSSYRKEAVGALLVIQFVSQFDNYFGLDCRLNCRPMMCAVLRRPIGLYWVHRPIAV